MIHDALDKVGSPTCWTATRTSSPAASSSVSPWPARLSTQPALLLLDEPLSNLDAKLREQARAWLKRLQADLGITTVYVTHDQDEALALSDRIAVMSEGNMMQIGTRTRSTSAPATAEVAAFVGPLQLPHRQGRSRRHERTPHSEAGLQRGRRRGRQRPGPCRPARR